MGRRYIVMDMYVASNELVLFLLAVSATTEIGRIWGGRVGVYRREKALASDSRIPKASRADAVTVR